MLIEAQELKSGDVFIFDNKEQVAIDTISKKEDCIWVTNRKFYITKENRLKHGFCYDYSNATVISITPYDMVDLIENIEQ